MIRIARPNETKRMNSSIKKKPHHQKQTAVTAAKKEKKKKKTRFDKIEIIELPITLGDNPSVKNGAPVSCCWAPQLRLTVSLDVFETHRPKRRRRQDLILGKNIREKLLLKHGFSHGDICQAELNAKRTKIDRMLSSQSPLLLVGLASRHAAAAVIPSPAPLVAI